MNLPEKHFDIICMPGSLSYLDITTLIKKLKVSLKDNGCFIAVDTYGYNKIFNFKRRLNYLFGKTTKGTLLGIPKKEKIEKIKSTFNSFEIKYFNKFAFLGPCLKYIVGKNNTAKILNKLDDLTPFLNKYAFKLVFCAKNIKR